MSVWTILRKNIKWRFHNAFTILVILLQPLLWLLLYSTIAGQTMENSGLGNYTAFILPGLIVLVSLSTCCSSGMMNYMMKTDGSFYRILIAPVSRNSIIAGQLLEAVLCTFLETAILAFAGSFFSVRLFPGFSETAAILVLIFLMSFFMAAVSYGVSLTLPNEMVYETVMNAVVLPIFFLSSALFPAAGLTGVCKTLISLNPFSLMIDHIRSLMSGAPLLGHKLIGTIILFLIMDVLAFAFARWRLDKRE